MRLSIAPSEAVAHGLLWRAQVRVLLKRRDTAKVIKLGVSGLNAETYHVSTRGHLWPLRWLARAVSYPLRGSIFIYASTTAKVGSGLASDATQGRQALQTMDVGSLRGDRVCELSGRCLPRVIRVTCRLAIGSAAAVVADARPDNDVVSFARKTLRLLTNQRRRDELAYNNLTSN